MQEGRASFNGLMPPVYSISAIMSDMNQKGALGRAVAAARLEAGLTQADLASKLGTTQSAVARLERGGVTPTIETLCRLADLLRLRFEVAPGQGLIVQRLPQRGLTLADLRAHRDEILHIAAEHGAANVRVFGSVARGESDEASDVDLLVDVRRDADAWAMLETLGELRAAYSELLSRNVDVLESGSLGIIRERVLGEAVPV
jgi:predicted nucleotidyltransferase/DNA-binding XRE family transcriptional regulator